LDVNHDFFLEETKKNKLDMYHDNDGVAPAVKREFVVTPDKRIQLATVERQTELHHKVERMIAYTREHIIV
jgi:alkyl hydroperoxide reductase subunit AhpC